jgi:hypothetical protein
VPGGWKQRLRGSEPGLVPGNEQHLRHVREWIIIALVEGEAARHAQQVVERDAAALVALTAPFRQQRLIGGCESLPSLTLSPTRALSAALVMDQPISGILASKPGA